MYAFVFLEAALRPKVRFCKALGFEGLLERARCADRRACNAVFGDGDPNTEYEEKRWKMVCHILVIHVS